MRRSREWTALFCTILCGLLCVAAKPKQEFKSVRPMGQANKPAAVPKAEPVTAEYPGIYSKIAPTTRAASVMVIDARSGEIFYEKNADAPRAAASTQKLLTALIVAERGFLDRTVTVERRRYFGGTGQVEHQGGRDLSADRFAPRPPGQEPE